MIYYFLAPDAAAGEAPPVYGADDPAGGSHAVTVSRFSAWTLQVVCYGPHALANARKIRAFLVADGPGFPRSILRKAGLNPVPDPPEPMLHHEPEGSLWRSGRILRYPSGRRKRKRTPCGGVRSWFCRK